MFQPSCSGSCCVDCYVCSPYVWCFVLPLNSFRHDSSLKNLKMPASPLRINIIYINEITMPVKISNTDSVVSCIQSIIKFPVTKKMFAISSVNVQRFTHCFLNLEKVSILYVFPYVQVQILYQGYCTGDVFFLFLSHQEACNVRSVGLSGGIYFPFQKYIFFPL